MLTLLKPSPSLRDFKKAVPLSHSILTQNKCSVILDLIMSRPEIPPKYVIVPARLVYDQRLSGAVFQTYVQLRGLAWGKHETPAVTMDDLKVITGKGRSTLYGHMTLLRSRGALLWRSAGKGTLILSFEPLERALPDDGGGGGSPESGIPESKVPEIPLSINPPHHSFRSSKNHNNGISPGEVRGKYGKGGLIEIHPGQDSGTLESTDPAAGDDPVGTYITLCNLKPIQAKREMIAKQVDDNDLWRKTIEHWIAHGWKPRNVAGMLNLYRQGGPAACRSCQDPPEREPTQRDIFRELLEE